eukprot:CAMPEP_0174304852 /NCGR_PEP_ID=MMETSP0809-20121228/61043_1 /TAXON_ID=73025 ORGANISM="Eutreptiella gymnastica-like, Strain CCMP1594" /NCGR_SAMPLE_ID=MMETSP0809 /ASSEMBLY_ACC=CAM_ASM_000658 /LENGTH=62 /DNA_ID=CAMNT_0015411181 /DNA_START=703 /DNA_END=891 /DNA_ORIENTATION=-
MTYGSHVPFVSGPPLGVIQPCAHARSSMNDAKIPVVPRCFPGRLPFATPQELGLRACTMILR